MLIPSISQVLLKDKNFRGWSSVVYNEADFIYEQEEVIFRKTHSSLFKGEAETIVFMQ